MVRIPGGTFRMGSDRHYAEEAPVHRVEVDAFWIDRTPVTNGQFRKFVNATSYVTFAEIAPDAVSGGSVSFELGTASHDTIELRDGSVVTGDVESMSATDLVIRVGGALQNISRNQVKRIVLIQRDPS